MLGRVINFNGVPIIVFRFLLSYLVLLILSLMDPVQSSEMSDKEKDEQKLTLSSQSSSSSSSSTGEASSTLLVDKQGSPIPIQTLPKPVITTFINFYKGLKVTQQDEQQFFDSKALKKPDHVPYILGDIQLYQSSSDVPLESICANFWNYEAKNSSLEQALEWAKKFTLYKGGSSAGLFLTGPAGTGKTHLALSIAKACAQQGERILFLQEKDFGNYDAYQNFSKIEINHPLIIVDAISEKNSYGRSAVKKVIKRIWEKGGTKFIVTTHMSYKVFCDDSVLREEGESFNDKLQHFFKVIEISGDSYRSHTNWFSGLS